MTILRTLTRNPGLSQERMLWHVETLAWLSNTFGPTHLPRVPTVLRHSPALSDSKHERDDMRRPMDWAEDVFARLVEDCHMLDWSLSLKEREAVSEGAVHSIALDGEWHAAAPGSFYVDVVGKPVVVVDRDTFSTPGRMVLSAIVQLAQLRMVSAPAPDHYRPQDHARLLMSVAVFNGQGLELLRMAQALTRYMVSTGSMKTEQAAGLVQELGFATVLGMRARGLQPEQIVASYGPMLHRSLRRRVWSMCTAMEGYGPELKLLRRLSAHGTCTNLSQASLRTHASA